MIQRNRPDPLSMPAPIDHTSVEHRLMKLCTKHNVEWLRSAAGPGAFRLKYGKKTLKWSRGRAVERDNTLMYFVRSQTVQIGPKTFDATPEEAIIYLIGSASS